MGFPARHKTQLQFEKIKTILNLKNLTNCVMETRYKLERTGNVQILAEKK